MSGTLAALARQLIDNPALTEALIALGTALEEDGMSERLAALEDACVSTQELERLLEQVEALAIALRQTPEGRH